MSVTLGDASLFAARRAVEERWCARVRAAKFRFDLVVAQALEAASSADLAKVEMFRLMEQEARDNYVRELEIFTDIVVRGKLPEDNFEE